MEDLDARDRRALEGLVRDLRERHGEALLAVALTGEAAGPAYRPRRSPLEVAVVLREVTPEALRRTRDRVGAWRRRRIPPPLLLDPLYLASAGDVFPLELLELRENHLLLEGEEDPFAELRFDAGHLRLEVEEQLRGKLLHLWEAYLGAGRSRRRLRQVLTQTPPAFELALRGLLRVADAEGAPPPADPEARLSAVEARFDLSLPVFHRLERARHSGERLPRGELESLFERYLAEVRAIVRAADGLARSGG